MSMRHVRKVFGGNSLPPPDPESEEEYEPLYAKVSPSKFNYHGLILSSHSESEHESTDAVGMNSPTPDPITKKKKKKKKKQHKLKQMPQSSSKGKFEELDEIDKSVLEVNAILGTPPAAAPSVSAEAPAADPKVDLLAVQAKHLNAAYELKKMFGPESPGPRRRGRQPNLYRLHNRKAVIVPVTDGTKFKKIGLSMSIHRRENDCIYFAFDHTKEYQRIHRAFLQQETYRGGNLTMSVEEAQKNLHVEGMLEGADSLFRYEAYSAANTLIEQTIAYMQYVAHLSFNLTDPKVRLEYRITENRPFHIAVLKYLYLLSNRACHRTALELAKMLLNLDPSDPLAVLFIIDTLALRAKEHQWLIDAVDYWSKERDAGFLFNIQYSYAMAHFHVANKSKGDTSKADELIRAAMLRYPGVLLNLLQSASATPSATVRACSLFSSADDTTGKNLRELMTLYGKLAWSWWREPSVFEWLTRNADHLAEQFNKETDTQESAKKMANERRNLFQGRPEQVARHLTVIKPMSEVLVEGAVPEVKTARSADPVPPAGGLDRYGYARRADAAAAAPALARHTPLYELFWSMLPHYEAQGGDLPEEFQRHIMEALGDGEAAPQLAEAAVEAALGNLPLMAEAREAREAGQEVEAGEAVDLSSEWDTLSVTDTDDDGHELSMSPGTVTDIIRQFINVYETDRLHNNDNADADANTDASADANADADADADTSADANADDAHRPHD